jgi:hypothetical protein
MDDAVKAWLAEKKDFEEEKAEMFGEGNEAKYEHYSESSLLRGQSIEQSCTN